jgi:hypothetical protein
MDNVQLALDLLREWSNEKLENKIGNPYYSFYCDGMNNAKKFVEEVLNMHGL